MRRVGVSVSVLVLVLLFVGCGGSDSGGGSPVAPAATPTVTSITVTLTTPVVAGTTAQATATAMMSNGTTQAITTGFKSDTPSVATVTDAGLVTGVSAGLANIYVVFGGQQGTKNTRVIPSFQGNWSGRYVISNCTQSGMFAAIDACDGMVGSTPAIYATLTQTGEAVNGRMGLGSLNTDSFTAPVGADGHIQFVGRIEGDPSIDCQFNLSSPAPGQLTGTVIQTWRFRDYIGSMVITGAVGTMTKSSATGMVLSSPGHGKLTVQELLKALKQ